MHDTDRQGSPGSVEDASLVGDLSSADLDPALANLVEELTGRIQAGGSVDAEDIAAQYPELADSIRQLFPALLGIAMVGRISNDESLPGSLGSDGERRFGEFTIGREIGRGGMGVVYEARQSPIGRRVALKILPPAAALDPQALKRFQLEAQVAGLLQHPGIVPVYAVGTHGGVPYYAMRYIEGRSLAELLSEIRELASDPEQRAENRLAKSPGPLTSGLLTGRFASFLTGSGRGASPTAQAPSDDTPAATIDSSVRGRAFIRTIARLGIEAAEALAFAHDQGVVHRDVKPANLLLDSDGHLWVADFGMADVQGDAGLTLTGDLPGTLRYMSPEQALGKRSLVDRRADIYALGATLFELLTLRPAVPGADRQEILRGLAEEEPPPARRLNPAIPVDLATIVAKCLAKDPAARYETARHLADDLNRFLDGRPIAARPVSLAARAWRWCRRKPALAALASSLALAILIGFAGITWNWREAVRQRHESRRQAARAEGINRFLIDKLLGQAEPEANPDAKKVTLLEVLNRAASEVGTSFEGQPEVEAAIRLTIGQAYHGLGEFSKSEVHNRAAYALLQGRPGVEEERLKAMSEYGHSLTHLDRLDEAEPLLTRAFDESHRILAPDNKLAMTSTDYLANLRQRQGRLPDAEALFRRALADARRYRGPRHAETLLAMNNLGVLLEKEKKFAEAEVLFRECMEIQLKDFGPNDLRSVKSLYNMGFILCDLGRIVESHAYLRRCVAGYRQILGEDHPDTLMSLSKLGEVLGLSGDVDEAEVMLRNCLDAQRRIVGPDHMRTKQTAARFESLMRTKSTAAGPRLSSPP